MSLSVTLEDVRAARRRIAGHVVALPDALLGQAPRVCGEALGVVGEGEEIEVGAVAREVAGVRGRVGALAPHQRQREEEAVPGVGGVHVEVAEEDLRGLPGPALRRQRVARVALLRRDRRGVLRGPGAALDLAGTLEVEPSACAGRERAACDRRQGSREPDLHPRARPASHPEADAITSRPRRRPPGDTQKSCGTIQPV